MPVYRIGDLVQVAPYDDASVRIFVPNAIGLIVEMREGPMHPEAKVKWSDMPEPFWIHISSLALVQTEQPVVE